MTEKSTGTDNSIDREAFRDAPKLSRLYLDSLRAADGAGACRVALRAVESGMTIPALYQRVIAPAMHGIGDLWEKGAITVADEHAATALTHRVLASLRPPVRVEVFGGRGAEEPGRGRALLAAVEGEQHALGLRMVADVLEDSGYSTIYLGADVPTDALMHSVDALSPDLLALSATMPELAPRLEEVAAVVRSTHPEVDLLLGGQATATAGDGARAIVLRDLELLSANRLPMRSRGTD